ncbi:MAG: hypothetical protein HY830_07330 [Actinobacteria bacterium]|nr:hypothetical protein [Actinomycetota bacterium]
MAEPAEDIHARAVAAAGPDGRLPAPPLHEGEIFPWDAVDGRVVPRPLAAPVDAEPARRGEDPDDCFLCQGRATPVWENDRWTLTRPDAPTGLPLLLWLNAKAHLDFADMDDDLAAEFGVLAARLCRAIEALDGVGRAHVNRWGDGSAHLHTWFVARPARLPQVLGSYAVEWDEILPPGPRDVWLADLAAVARALATHSGRAHL